MNFHTLVFNDRMRTSKASHSESAETPSRYDHANYAPQASPDQFPSTSSNPLVGLNAYHLSQHNINTLSEDDPIENMANRITQDPDWSETVHSVTSDLPPQAFLNHSENTFPNYPTSGGIEHNLDSLYPETFDIVFNNMPASIGVACVNPDFIQMPRLGTQDFLTGDPLQASAALTHSILPESDFDNSPASTSLPNLPDPPPTGRNIRTCTHCGTISTTAWRRVPTYSGPMCNACGLYLQQRNMLRPQALIDADAEDDEGPSETYTGPECSHCHTRKTSVWRRSKEGDHLCNACGVYIRLHGKERPLSLRKNTIKPRMKRDAGE